ncbi:MEDS domain-containing protein [Nitrososphaera sp. AFS]|uniref:MEDS domain-containing protein n=1 Tax=Nitrososphaera sp. AFS TaxID=2301191 RepID=UPI0013922EEC
MLFYEETEYARIILFEFLKNGLLNKERCVYISEENVEAVEREMSDAGINTEEFMKNELLSVHQVPNLAGYSNITQTTLENLSQFALHPWTKDGRPDRLVLRCIFKINTQDQIRSNLEWERQFRAKDLKLLQGTMICTYPVSNIIPTISDPNGDYGKWMSDLLELYDGVIFARKFWTGVAFFARLIATYAYKNVR